LNPSTFLNQERFNDQPAQSNFKLEHKPSEAELEEQERKRIAHLMKLAGRSEGST
jgi:hypothetical protein